MRSDDFFSFLSRSIDLLKVDSGENYLRLATTLNGLSASVSTGGESRRVYFDRRQLVIDETLASSDIEIAFHEQAVLDLIDGKYSLEQSVLNGTIFIRGSVDAIDKFHSALRIYLNGALRSQGFVELLSGYRSQLC